jgi:hypothetical protein
MISFSRTASTSSRGGIRFLAGLFIAATYFCESDSMSENEQGKRSDRYQRAAAAGLGSAVGLPLGPAGVVAGAAAGVLLEPFAAKVWDEVSSDARRRGGEALSYTQTATSLNDEEFERLVTDSERTRLLTGVMLSAASRTVWDGKLRTLGRSLASGLLATDEAIIDCEQMIMAAIADLEAPHLSLLDLLVSYTPIRRVGQQEPEKIEIPTYSYYFSSHLPPEEQRWAARDREWTVEQIGFARPRLVTVLSSLLGTLQGHGLALLDINTDKSIEKFSAELERETNRVIGPPSRGTNAKGLIRAPRISRVPTEEPTWSPTELGEQVWVRFRDAGVAVPDAWLSTPNSDADLQDPSGE